jgi:hypothetical protein
MPNNPLNPRMLRGAIVAISLPNPMPRVIAFQYNPETLTRTLEAQMAGEENSDRAEALRLKGAPVETIKLDIEMDASDQLESGDPIAKDNGIYPQLSSLEMIIYPATETVIANTILLNVGTLEIIPPAAPFTLFIWGHKRILPVRLTEFSITEEAHDVNLNPIRAKVSLGLRVLSYNDLPVTHPGYNLFLAHQVAKEVMARIGSTSNLEDMVGGNTRLI